MTKIIYDTPSFRCRVEYDAKLDYYTLHLESKRWYGWRAVCKRSLCGEELTHSPGGKMMYSPIDIKTEVRKFIEDYFKIQAERKEKIKKFNEL